VFGGQHSASWILQTRQNTLARASCLYLIAIHLVVFFLLRALGNAKQQIKDKEEQQK
jgi:hypothetical protein